MIRDNKEKMFGLVEHYIKTLFAFFDGKLVNNEEIRGQSSHSRKFSPVAVMEAMKMFLSCQVVFTFTFNSLQSLSLTNNLLEMRKWSKNPRRHKNWCGRHRHPFFFGLGSLVRMAGQVFGFDETDRVSN